MRIFQCPVPASRLKPEFGPSIVDTLSYFTWMARSYRPLIDDGSTGDVPSMEKPVVNPITGETALLFCAKDMDTLRRGFEAYSATWVLWSGEGKGVGDGGGLGMIVATYDRRNLGAKVGKFFKWGVNNVKQRFIHDSFKLALWLTRRGLDNNDDLQVAEKKLASLFRKVGGDHLFTFGDFCRAIDSEGTMQSRGALILICRSVDIPANFEVPGGRVERYVSNSIKVQTIGDYATRLFKKSKQREHNSGGIFD